MAITDDVASASFANNADLAETALITLGGMSISVIDRATQARLMIKMVSDRANDAPLFFTSANGEVIARASADEELARLFAGADQVVADGQPLVIASRYLCRTPLPERAATTDLFHDVASLAEETGTTFYMFGAQPEQNARAVAAATAKYPRLKIVGSSHGFLSGEALDAKLAEINALSPDILWLGLGVPREQYFFRDHGAKLRNVGLIKTAGGLFDHMAGGIRRAPVWAQSAGLEWLWRMLMEPRRLFWRYLTTNPVAMWLLLTRSS